MSITMKFGGTSVADAKAISNAARIVANRKAASPVVVVSAMSGVTDALLGSVALAKSDPKRALESLNSCFDRHKAVAENLLSPDRAASFCAELSRAHNSINELLHHSAKYSSLAKAIKDEIVCFGEILSSSLFAEVLTATGNQAQFIDSRVVIVTNDQHGRAEPFLPETFERCRNTLSPIIAAGTIPVLGGFIAATCDGATTTLGRGGSDYTASLIGAGLESTEIQIWTDVNGVLSADPRVVSNASTVDKLSYGEAAELAYFGAKVLHPKTIQPAIEGEIPVRICNSRQPEHPGTLVCSQSDASPLTVKAIAHKKGVTTLQITSAGMLGAYGFLRAIFEVFERERTVVDVVTTSEVSVSLSLDDATALPQIVESLQTLGTLTVEHGRAIICVVGEGLRGTPGIAANVFSTISDINVSLISQGASSINLTFAVEDASAEEVVRRLHHKFFENNVATMNA